MNEFLSSQHRAWVADHVKLNGAAVSTELFKIKGDVISAPSFPTAPLCAVVGGVLIHNYYLCFINYI